MPRRFEYTEPHMGVPIRLALYCTDENAANSAAAAVFARFAELNRLLSDYDPESEISRLSRSAPHAEPQAVSDSLWFVLCRSQKLAEETRGAFDITVGPMVRLWRRARRNLEMPSDTRLADARAVVGYSLVKLIPEKQTVLLSRPGMQLDLGGIAMGYAVDEGLKILAERGISSAMIDASGDIGVSGPPPGTTGWQIGIMPLKPDGPPSKYLRLANAAITTSGDAYQHVTINGQRYSHIVNPHTGLGLTDQSAVTIVAPDCITVDSVATAVSVLGPTAGLKFVESQPGVAAMILRAGEPPEVYESSRWKQLTFEPAP